MIDGIVPGERPAPPAPTSLCPLESLTNVRHLRELVARLWDILDDIDTAEDMARGDPEIYRSLIRHIHDKRRRLLLSDGHKLFVVEPDPAIYRRRMNDGKS